MCQSNDDLRRRQEEKLTNRNAQAVQAEQAATAVAAGKLLAVAALGAVLLAVDVCFGGVRGGCRWGCGGQDGGGEDDELGEGGHFDEVDWVSWLMVFSGLECEVFVFVCEC
jgi:hypothetical protein